MLNGWKTYLGGAGLMFVGLGGILTHETSLVSGLTKIAMGLVAVGARSFGAKLLDVLKTVKE